jgi:hypothetical protein
LVVPGLELRASWFLGSTTWATLLAPSYLFDASCSSWVIMGTSLMDSDVDNFLYTCCFICLHLRNVYLHLLTILIRLFIYVIELLGCSWDINSFSYAYFLPSCRLYLHSVKDLLCCAEAF